MRPAWFSLTALFGLFTILSSALLTSCGISQPSTSTQVSSSRWEAIAPPIAGPDVLSYAGSPADPATLYACTQDQANGDGVLLWRTRDTGRHWSRLALPAVAGRACWISLDPTGQRVAVQIINQYEQRACDREAFYFSKNKGESWQQVPHLSLASPKSTFGFCTLQVTNTHLYLWTSYGEGRGMDARQVSILERSDDLGASWARIDSAFGRQRLFLPPQIGLDGETLTISTAGELWTSHDAGQSWQTLGPVPGDTMVFTSSQPPLNAPFYDLTGEQLPSFLYATRAYQSNDGYQWSELPPLPAPGTNAQHPGLLQVLTALDDGRLLAFGVDPKAGLPSHPSSANDGQVAASWLWLWNPGTERWQVLSLPLAHPEREGCGLCWSAFLSTGSDHATYLYVSHLGNTLQNETTRHELYRVRIPDTQ